MSDKLDRLDWSHGLWSFGFNISGALVVPNDDLVIDKAFPFGHPTAPHMRQDAAGARADAHRRARIFRDAWIRAWHRPGCVRYGLAARRQEAIGNGYSPDHDARMLTFARRDALLRGAP